MYLTQKTDMRHKARKLLLIVNTIDDQLILLPLQYTFFTTKKCILYLILAEYVVFGSVFYSNVIHMYLYGEHSFMYVQVTLLKSENAFIVSQFRSRYLYIQRQTLNLTSQHFK